MPNETAPIAEEFSSWDPVSEEFAGWEGADVPAMPPVRISPYESARLQGPTAPMGIMGPAAPEEVRNLGQILQIPATLAEPVFTAAEDMATDFFRRYGIDPSAQPGQPMVQIERIPGLLGAPSFFLPESVKPEFLKGAERGAAKLVTGMLTPGQIGFGIPIPEITVAKGIPKLTKLLGEPIAGLKPVQAMFAGSVLGALPETLAEIPKAQTAGELGERLATAGGEAAMIGGIGAHMARPRLLPRSALEAAKEREVADASRIKETTEVYGDLRTQPEQGAEGVPVEGGSAGVRPEAPVVAKETQVPLTPEEQRYLQAEREAIDTPIEEVDTSLPENAPFARRLAGNIATIDRETGRILINSQEFSSWLKSIPSDRRSEAVKSLVSEENIHLNVTDAMADAYWKTLTGLEKAINRRRYVGTWAGERLKSGEPVKITDTNFGHEALRFRMQQLARLTPREVAEAVGRERWTVQSITAIESAVRGLREALGTKASAEAKAILDRVQFNLNGAKAVMAQSPAALRKYEGIREDPDTLIGEVNLMDPEQFAAFATTLPKGMTMASFDLGRSLTRPDQLMALQAARGESGRLFREAMKNKDIEAALAYSNKTQFYREAIEAATGSGGSGDLLRGMDPTYKPPFPEAAEEFPAALQKYERTNRDVDSYRIAKEWLDFAERILGEGRTPVKLSDFTDLDIKMALPEDRMGKYGPKLVKALRANAIADAKNLIFSNPEKYPNVIKAFGKPKEPPPAALSKPRTGTEAIAERWVYAGIARDVTEGVQMLANERNTRDLAERMVYRGEANNVTEAMRAIEQGTAPKEIYTTLRNWAYETAADEETAAALRKRTEQPGRLIRGFYKESEAEDLAADLKDKNPNKYYVTLPVGSRWEVHEYESKPDVIGLTGRKPWLGEPAALRKKSEGAQPELFLPPVKAGEQVSRQAPPSPQVQMQFGPATTAAERPSGFRPMTGFESERQAYRYIHQAVEDFISKPAGITIPKSEMAALATGEKPKRTKPTKGAPPPSWQGFVEYMRSQFGALQPGQLGEIWDRAVYRRLENASGEVLSELRRGLNLRNQLGDREVADPPRRRPSFTLEQEAAGEGRAVVAEARKKEASAQNYRNTVIRAIATKLIGERLKESKPLVREITPDDVGFGRERKEPAFNELRSDIRDDPAKVGPTLVADAREFDQPVSVTKRLTVLRNRATNTIEMVSTFLDGRRGVVLLDPSSPSKTHAKLADVIKRYQPIASVLLDEPVKGFRKTFKDIRTFEDEFATEVRQRASQESLGEISAEREFTPGPTTGRYATPGIFQAEAGAVEKISRESLSIQPDEAMSIMDHVTAEVGTVESPQDIRDALNGLKDRADAGTLGWMDWQAISGYQKIYDAIREKWPILDPEQAFDQMVDEVYEHARTAESTADFSAKTQAAYRREPPPTLRPDAERKAQAAAPSTARELEARERPAPIESAEVPISEATRTEAETYLSPDAAAYVSSQEYINAQRGELIQPRYSQTLYRQLAAREVPKTPYRMGKTKAAFPGEEEAPPAGTESPPAALRKYVDGTKTIIDQTLVDALRTYSEWMVERLRRNGGPKTEALAADLNHIIDRERTHYGSLTPTLDPARKAAGRMNQATTWMSAVRQVTPTAGVANAIDAVENRRAPPPFAVPLTDLVRQANYAIGQLIATVIPNFVPTGRFQRNLTALGYDVVRRGEGPMFEAFVNGVAAINTYNPATVRAFFRDWKAILDDPGVDAEAIERVNQDYQRKFPQTISHVKYMGQWQEVMHANVFNYLETAARRASHITAFREVFPSTTAGRSAFAKLMKDVREELPGEFQPDLRNVMRALQGHPTDNYSNWGLLAPGKPAAELFRFVNQTIGNLFARLVLTGQMAVQPGENIAGSTPVFLGYRNYLEGIARLGPLPFQSPMYRQLELTGRVNRAIHDYSFDRTSPVRSTFRLTGNIISKLFAEQFLNELQEAWSASTAQVVAERVTSGNLSAWEKRMLPQTFRSMGFTPAEVARLMAGDAELLSQFQGKAAAFLTSGNKAIAEGSAMGSNRLLNSIFRFQAYPMMKSNQLRKVTGQMLEAWSSGTGAEKRASTEAFARFMFGNTVQGALTVAIAALAYEGLFGAKIKANEAKDDLAGFLTESFLSSVSGPMYLLWRGAKTHSGMKGYGEQATRMIFPYSIARDLTDFAWGTGQYRDMDTFDKTGKFVRTKLPGTRALAQGLAMVGLSHDNIELDDAIRAFYRWRRDELGYSTYETFFTKDDRENFRVNMKKAVEALKNHDRKAYAQAYGAALAEKGKKTVAASMRARRILKTPDGKDLTPKQRLMLRKHIGDDAYRKLVIFDSLMDAASQ